MIKKLPLGTLTIIRKEIDSSRTAQRSPGQASRWVIRSRRRPRPSLRWCRGSPVEARTRVRKGDPSAPAHQCSPLLCRPAGGKGWQVMNMAKWSQADQTFASLSSRSDTVCQPRCVLYCVWSSSMKRFFLLASTSLARHHTTPPPPCAIARVSLNRWWMTMHIPGRTP